MPARFPHTRGGVPPAALATLIICRVFPTRVGVYREAAGKSDYNQGVFPTRVGVYRVDEYGGMPMNEFSPHAWGCTGKPQQAVVGARGKPLRFPHTRGGVPRMIVAASLLLLFSPHAWGCTASPAGCAAHVLRFPHTRGGVPLSGGRCWRGYRFPHTRGGVPITRRRCV